MADSQRAPVCPRPRPELGPRPDLDLGSELGLGSESGSESGSELEVGLTVVTGPAGSGKSTLLRRLAGGDARAILLAGLGRGAALRSVLASALVGLPRTLCIDDSGDPIGPRVLTLLSRYARSGRRRVVVVTAHPLAGLYADRVVRLPAPPALAALPRQRSGRTGGSASGSGPGSEPAALASGGART